MISSNSNNFNKAIIGEGARVEIRSIYNSKEVLPMAFDPNKLKDVIEEFLKVDYFENIEVIEETLFNNFYRDIEKKNIINGVNEEYFSIIEEDFQKYFEDINKFLKYSINRKIREKYHLIAKKLNMSYRSNYSEKRNLPEHIQFVQEKVYNEIANIEDTTDLYLSIFLHHMYFYCEYGINPKS